MKKNYVPFNTLLKSVLIISSPALIVLGLYVFFGVLNLSQMMYGYGLVFLATGALIYLFGVTRPISGTDLEDARDGLQASPAAG